MDIFDTRVGSANTTPMQTVLVEVVARHEQQIKDIAAQLLELKQRITPMMEFKRGMSTTEFDPEKLTAKCSVKDCESRMGQEYFNGFLCSPCHQFVSGEGGLYSQAARNQQAMVDASIAIAIETERAIVKQPTKICGPNLVGILNSAGFYKKDEWVGLTAGEAAALWASTDDRDSFELLKRVEAKLKEKNGETH